MTVVVVVALALSISSFALNTLTWRRRRQFAARNPYSIQKD